MLERLDMSVIQTLALQMKRAVESQGTKYNGD